LQTAAAALSIRDSGFREQLEDQMTKTHATSTLELILLAIGALVTTAHAQQPVFPGNRIVPTMPAPAAPGPKKAGMLRIGVAPSQAQMGQGSNAQGDFGAPIRNSIVLLMNGPAVEIVRLDAHLTMQMQAEALQKQCDYVLFSNVTVKHGSGGSGFGKFMKMAAPAASVLPMAGAGRMTGAVAGQAAGMAAMAAAQSAQEQAFTQLSGFNGQIKSKDDVTVGYRLMPTGQDKPRLENSLNAKASTDGEDVLTPLILKAADSILTEVTKK
jgi:hypothetical protein